MAVLTTIGSKEDFIVQMNGDYNVAFDEVNVTVAGNSGDVIAVKSTTRSALRAGVDTASSVDGDDWTDLRRKL